MSPAAERSRIVEPPSCASSPATTASAAVVPGVPVKVTRVVAAPVAWALPVPSERLPLSATRSMSSPAVAEVIATSVLVSAPVVPPRAEISTPAVSVVAVMAPPAKRPMEPAVASPVVMPMALAALSLRSVAALALVVTSIEVSLSSSTALAVLVRFAARSTSVVVSDPVLVASRFCLVSVMACFAVPVPTCSRPALAVAAMPPSLARAVSMVSALALTVI